jgi:hypothetical protein
LYSLSPVIIKICYKIYSPWEIKIEIMDMKYARENIGIIANILNDKILF